MAGERAKGGRKNRKFGRNLRSPAAKRYKAEDRCAKNKARNIAKDAKQKEKKHTSKAA